MEKKTIDARGLYCPQPVVETKKVLDKTAGGRVEVLVDTVTSRENVLRFDRKLNVLHRAVKDTSSTTSTPLP